MSKFTPAPWRVTEQILDETDTNLITDIYNGVSAGAGYLDNDEDGTGVGFSFTGCMNRADANLIAAAPRLYEALQRTIYHPIFGTKDRAKEREFWMDEKAQGREEADDRISALDALDQADGVQP